MATPTELDYNELSSRAYRQPPIELEEERESSHMHEDLIARTRFTSEDLFALMGGFDVGWLVCPITMTGPDDPALRRKLDRWRRAAVRRHLKSGLVDDACTPCPELADALAPLCGLPVVAMDAPGPVDPAEGDARSRAVYALDDGRATAVRRGGGLFGGWFVMSLPGEDAVTEAVLALHGLCGRVRPGGAPRRVVVPPAPGFPWMRAAMDGREDAVEAEARRWGYDPQPLLEFSRWWASEGRAAWETGSVTDAMCGTVAMEGPIASWVYDRVAPVSPALVEYSTTDYRGCEAVVSSGIRTGLVNASTYRSTTVWPAAGLCFSLLRAPRAGDTEMWWSEHGRDREFGSFDVLESEGQLARTLLMVDAFPEGGRAVTYEDDGIPLWGRDGR